VAELCGINTAQLATNAHHQELGIKSASHGLAGRPLSGRDRRRLIDIAAKVVVLAAEQPLRINLEDPVSNLRHETALAHNLSPSLRA
jgi:hypothetical protein